MKLTATLAVLVAALFNVQAHAEAAPEPEPTMISDDSGLTNCVEDQPDHYHAILKFCENNQIMVPSTYASNGHTVNGSWVRIEGTCNPPEWVPIKACRWNFYRVCGSTTAPTSEIHFGTNGCQSFQMGGSN